MIRAHRRFRYQPLTQLRPPPPPRHVTHRYSDGFLLSDQHHKPLAACDASVEQVSLQHRVMLREYRDDHGGIFRALAFVDGGRVSGHQHVELAKSVSHGPTVETRNDRAGIGVDVIDITDIAVVDLLVVIILDLHDLVAGSKSPAESLHLAITGRIESSLQLDVQRTCAYAAAVHRT